VGVLLGNGDGTFDRVVDYYPGGTPPNRTISAAVADLTGDGRPELLVTASSTKVDIGQVGVLLNNSAPNASHTDLSTSGSPSFINQPVTFTANVFSNGGSDGLFVTFYDGTTAIGRGVIASGIATFLNVLASGEDTRHQGNLPWQPAEQAKPG